MQFVKDDGGRAAAGFKGPAGDCVVRAIAIATGLPYMEVYAALRDRNAAYAASRHTRTARKLGRKGATPRDGNFKDVYKDYLHALGYQWTPTMQIGQGCTVHLCADELPSGRLLVQVSRHLVAVLDGVLHDTHDCTRGGRRCVYGYWQLNPTLKA